MDNLNIIKQQYPEEKIGRAQDLSNQIFGKWKVLYRTKNNSNNKVQWVCECSCEKHTIKPVEAKSLKAGTSTNCGCSRLETIANNADIKIHKRDQSGKIILKKCSRCGEWLSLDNFWKNASCKDGYHNECKNCCYTAKENRYNIYKKNAKKRNIDFNLTKQQFYDLTAQPCYYCGELNNYNGIDRVDSSKNYTLDNCVPCCSYCNKMKMDYSKDFWLSHMKKILVHLKEI